MSDTPQREIAGRYRLLRPLGQGAMGRVWLARDEMLQRDVALKEIVPPAGLSGDEVQELRERALREARAIAKVSQSNVVRIFDVLRTGDEPWIVMEYVPNTSLQKAIATSGPVTPAEAAEIGLRVLGALRAAHAVGVLHRDIKPANVLLGTDGRVVLTDFGLATATDDPGMTRTGVVMGSPAYLAPERAVGGEVGASADLWSLGASLYAAVEGRAPYTRPSSIATLAALATELPAMPKNAGSLLPALEGLLRRDPARRVDAFEAERLLRHALSGAPPHAGAGMASGTWANPDASPSGAGAASSGGSSARRHSVPVSHLSQGRPRHAGPTTMLPTARHRPDGGPTVEIPPGPSMPLPQYPPPRSPSETRSLYLLIGARVVVLVLAIVLGVRLFNPPPLDTGDAAPPTPVQTLPTAARAPSPTPDKPTPTPSPTLTAAVPTTPPAAAAPPVLTPVAQDRMLINVGSNRCFSVAGSNPAAPEPIHIWDCDGTPGTKFTLPGTGALQVLGNCIQADTADVGSRLHIAPCTGDLAQTFGLSEGGDLINIKSNKCLDVTGGAVENGTQVQLYECNGSPAQKWALS